MPPVYHRIDVVRLGTIRCDTFYTQRLCLSIAGSPFVLVRIIGSLDVCYCLLSILHIGALFRTIEFLHYTALITIYDAGKVAAAARDFRICLMT